MAERGSGVCENWFVKGGTRHLTRGGEIAHELKSIGRVVYREPQCSGTTPRLPYASLMSLNNNDFSAARIASSNGGWRGLLEAIFYARQRAKQRSVANAKLIDSQRLAYVSRLDCRVWSKTRPRPTGMG